MKNKTFKFSIGVFLLLTTAGAAKVNSQRPLSEILSDFGTPHLEQCYRQEPKVKKTYALRSPEIVKPYGKRNWFDSFKKVMPFWISLEGKQMRDANRDANSDVQLLLDTYGRLPPIGESARSKKIRDDVEEKLKVTWEEGEKNGRNGSV